MVGNSEFVEHFRDILDFRTEDYRRFRKRLDPLESIEHITHIRGNVYP